MEKGYTAIVEVPNDRGELLDKLFLPRPLGIFIIGMDVITEDTLWEVTLFSERALTLTDFVADWHDVTHDDARRYINVFEKA